MEKIQPLLETTLLLTAFLITLNRSISNIITIYQIQSVLLALVTALQSYDQSNWVILLIIFLPLLLALVIRPLLARATLLPTTNMPLWGWLWGWLRYQLPLLRPHRADDPGVAYAKQLQRDAAQEWLRPQHAFSARGGDIFSFVLMLLVALLIASQITLGNKPAPTDIKVYLPVAIASQITSGGKPEPTDTMVYLPVVMVLQITLGDKPANVADQIGLLTSLLLALSGLYNMVIKQDIISQVIGLLMMDHGLYLAVVKIVPVPYPATFFVIALYFYTLITVFILVILLPRVCDAVKSIDLTDVRARSDLKG